jgi:phage protein D
VIAVSKIIVEADGAPLPADAAATIGQVRIQQRLSQPSVCEVTFFDPPRTFREAKAPSPGTSLKLIIRGREPALFDGEVTAVEHVYGPAKTCQIVLRGYDLLHRLRKRQPVRTHVQVTPAELARELTSDLGIDVSAEEDGPLVQRIIQSRQSDLDVLIEVTERNGIYFTLQEKALRLITFRGFGDPISLSLGESLMEARIAVNGHSSCRSVVTIGWDPARVEAHSGKANTPRSSRRIATEVDPEQVGGKGDRTLTDIPLQDDRQAEAFAQAFLDLRLAQEVTLWGIADGDPQLRPGTPVLVGGMSPSLDGQYTLVSVNHVIDGERGFISEISSSPPSPRTSSAGALALWGVVTKADDPEELGRVQVSLPAFGNIETGWIGVVAAGAGAKKGLVMIPDVGDNVLLISPQGDPAQSIVIGGLYGADGLPGGIARTPRRPFTLMSPGGQVIQHVFVLKMPAAVSLI